MKDTKIGASKKDDPSDVAKTGFEATPERRGRRRHGLDDKLQTAIANITPSEMLAERHHKQAERGSAQQ